MDRFNIHSIKSIYRMSRTLVKFPGRFHRTSLAYCQGTYEATLRTSLHPRNSADG